MDPYIGEIRMFGGNFAPVDWALCDGRLISISDNSALFSLIGTTYGGNGQTDFALPDLRGRVPVHQAPNQGVMIGQQGGTEQVTLLGSQTPAHTHNLLSSNSNGTTGTAAGNVFANSGGGDFYVDGLPQPVTLSPMAVTSVGAGQPHDNMQPYLCVNYIIALQGIWPTHP